MAGWCAHGKDVATGVDYQMWNISGTLSKEIVLPKSKVPNSPVEYTTNACATEEVPEAIGDNTVTCFDDRATMAKWAALGVNVSASALIGSEPMTASTVASWTRIGRMAAVCHVATREPRWVCHRPEYAHLHRATPVDGAPDFNVACHRYPGWPEPVCHAMRNGDTAWLSMAE